MTGDLSVDMPILNACIQIGFALVVAGVVLAFVRLILGPSLPDRVVALDTMTVLIVAFCGLYALQTGVAAFLDVAVVLALIGFLATVALARYIERRVGRAPERGAETPAPPASGAERDR